MSIELIHGDFRNAPRELIEPERLAVIGYIDSNWGDDHYPTPLFELDNRRITRVVGVAGKDYERIKALRPTYYESPNLIAGAWEAEINLPKGETHGAGWAYIGQGQDTKGYIFEAPTAYHASRELGFVRDNGEETVLHEQIIRDEPYKLVYAPATALEQLGKFALY